MKKRRLVALTLAAITAFGVIGAANTKTDVTPTTPSNPSETTKPALPTKPDELIEGQFWGLCYGEAYDKWFAAGPKLRDFCDKYTGPERDRFNSGLFLMPKSDNRCCFSSIPNVHVNIFAIAAISLLLISIFLIRYKREKCL